MGQFHFSHSNGISSQTHNNKWASTSDPNSVYGVVMDYSNKRIVFHANNDYATNNAFMPLKVAITGNARRVQ